MNMVDWPSTLGAGQLANNLPTIPALMVFLDLVNSFLSTIYPQDIALLVQQYSVDITECLAEMKVCQSG
jgi:hypothetical protein